MKKIVVLIVVALLAGCSDSVSQVNFTALPEELKDCKIYSFSLKNGVQNVTVIRCPNSVVSTKTGGKYPRRTVTIDGVTYEQKEDK